MNVLCMSYAFLMHVLCISYAFLVHVLCTYAFLMRFLCTFNWFRCIFYALLTVHKQCIKSA